MKGSSLCTVKEFDRIIASSDPHAKSLKGEKDVHIIDDEAYLELQSFLASSVEEDEKPLYKATKQSSHPRYGLHFQMKNYVGVIELPRSGLRIEVLPKIFDGTKVADAKKLKAILLRMLSSLRDLPALEAFSASLDLTSLSLYEILIRIYLERVLSLAKPGLKSGYVEKEENLTCFRGRLHVSNQIRHNICHAERFYVRYDDYDLGRPENRLIKTALISLKSVTRDHKNLSLIRQALRYFENIPASKDFEADYRSIAFGRDNQNYLATIQWSIVFLRKKSFSIFGGGCKGQALLFPMERIFECYVAHRIGETINAYNRKYGTSHAFHFQEHRKYLFDLPKKFHLRPDIKLDEGIDARKTVILDTKWKTIAKESRNSGIAQADMYQMYAYSKRYHATNVYLVYPETIHSSSISELDYKDTFDPSLNTTISLRFLNIASLALCTKRDLLTEKNPIYRLLKEVLFSSCEPVTLLARESAS